jgi:pyrroloquinoline-quinone synthase
MSTMLERLDLEIERRSLLKHPFYRMWSSGQLTHDHLRGYTKEYFHLVKAVPGFTKNIYDNPDSLRYHNELATNIKEESDHIEPWIRFAGSLGVSKQALLDHTPALKTIEAVSCLDKLTRKSLEEAVSTMYGYEKELPKISSSKIQGLKEYYRMDSIDSTHYFEIHEEADIRHAGLWIGILKEVSASKASLVLEAEVKSLEAQNYLLDSIYEKYIGQCD